MRGLHRPAALLFAAMSVAAVVGTLGAGSAAAQQPQIVGHPAATATVTFDVYLPLRHSAALDALLAAQQRVGSSQYHRWLTPAGFAARFGADPGEVARITASLQSAGLTVQASGSHSLRVSGPVATVEKLFATRLATGRFADGHVRLVAETAMTTPGALAGTGAVVAQFLPVEHMHADAQVVGHAPPPNRYGPTGPYLVRRPQAGLPLPVLRAGQRPGRHDWHPDRERLPRQRHDDVFRQRAARAADDHRGDGVRRRPVRPGAVEGDHARHPAGRRHGTARRDQGLYNLPTCRTRRCSPA